MSVSVATKTEHLTEPHRTLDENNKRAKSDIGYNRHMRMHRSTAVIAAIGVLAGGMIATGSAHAAERANPAYVTITSTKAPEQFRGIVHTGKKPRKKTRIGVATCENSVCTITRPSVDIDTITKRLFITPTNKKGKPKKKTRYRVFVPELPDMSIPTTPEARPDPSNFESGGGGAVPSDATSPGSTLIPSDLPSDDLNAGAVPRSTVNEASRTGSSKKSTAPGRTLADMQSSIDKKTSAGAFGPQAHPNGLGGWAYDPGNSIEVNGVLIPANEFPVCPLDHYDGNIYTNSPILWNGVEIPVCSPRPGLTPDGFLQ